MAADEGKIFTILRFSEWRGKGERRVSCARETERAAALSLGSHFVFFPVLPNMELQSCSVLHQRRQQRRKNCKVPGRFFLFCFFFKGKTGKKNDKQCFKI